MAAMTDEELERLKKKYAARIKAMRLMDDDFMTTVFAFNKNVAELVIRIIVSPNIVIDSVRTQVDLHNPVGRSIRMDAHAIDNKHRHFNIEMQRSDKGAAPQRARYNLGMLDVVNLPRGVDYAYLPETFIIFITEHDVFGKGLPLYHVERTIQETGELFGDEEHIIFVNGAYTGDDPVGQLMADFRTNEPKEMHYEELAEAAGYFKNDTKGVAYMCRIMEEIATENYSAGAKAGVKDFAAKLAELRKALESVGRDKEFVEAACNPDIAQALFEEFGI